MVALGMVEQSVSRRNGVHAAFGNSMLKRLTYPLCCVSFSRWLESSAHRCLRNVDSLTGRRACFSRRLVLAR